MQLTDSQNCNKSITSGRLLNKPEVIDSNEKDYFQNYLRKVENDSVIFNQVIFDSDKFFDLKCLVITDNGVKATLKPFGKIANVDKIEVAEFKKGIFSIGNIYFMILGLITGWFVPDAILLIFKKTRRRRYQDY